MKKDNKLYLLEVIHLLKSLNYEFENWNEDWVDNVLTTACSSRNNLLSWTLQQLGLCPISSHSSFMEFSVNKTHRELVSVGICKTSDLNIIEASANPVSQLKFWKHILKVIDNTRLLKQNPANKCLTLESDNLLDRLVHSSFYQEFQTKDKDFSLLPADLKKQYDDSEKIDKEVFNTRLAQTVEIVESLRTQNSHNQDIVNEFDKKDLHHSLSSLTDQVNLLPEIYESCFGHWCNVSNEFTSAASSVTSCNVNQNYKHFDSCLKTFTLEEQMKSSVSEIEENLHSLRVNGVKHGSAKVLSSITSIIN